jgi:thymidylate kinase
MVEITGSPSAGKTTIIKSLDDFLRDQGLRVLRPQEGAEVIRHIPRSTPVYNIATGLYALTKFIEESYCHKYDIIIFDRCIFDAYCWMEYWHEKSKLEIQDKHVIQNFFLQKFFTENIDAAYFVVCDPKIAMERELRVSILKKDREMTNPKSIANLVARYRDAFSLLSTNHPQLKLIDTSEMDEQAMVEQVALDILNVLEAKSKT